MNKRAWIAAACAIVLTACAHMGGKEPAGIDPRANPDAVVWVQNGVIQVVPPTMFFEADKKNFRIVWEIRDVTVYRFGAENSDKPGIVIERPDGEIVDCKLHPHGKRFSCHNRHTKKGKYKYTINLVSVLGGPSLSLDPIIVND